MWICGSTGWTTSRDDAIVFVLEADSMLWNCGLAVVFLMYALVGLGNLIYRLCALVLSWLRQRGAVLLIRRGASPR